MRKLTSFVVSVLCLAACGGDDASTTSSGTSATTSSSSSSGSGGGGGGAAADEVQILTDSDPTQLMSLYGAARDDIHLFGGIFGTPESGKIFHYDGSKWSSVDPGKKINHLIWSYGFGPNDIWAVGQQGTALHWDGSSWTQVDSGTTVDIWGIWGAAPDDIWAVGGVFGVGQGTILHYDGAAWSTYDATSLDLGTSLPIKVWGTSATKAWATAADGIILKYDGTSWTRDASPIEGQPVFLVGMDGTSDSDVYAVGGPLSPPGTILHYDGTAWSVLENELASTLINIARIPGTDELITVGIGGYAAILDKNGIKKELSTGTDILLHGLAPFGRDDMLMSGGNILDQGVPAKGVLLYVGSDAPTWQSQ